MKSRTVHSMVKPFSQHVSVIKEKVCQVFHTEAHSEFSDKAKSGRGGAGDQSHSSDTWILRDITKT